ncbi:3-oxoacyl-ACP reductase FabG [Arcobacter porcinus]|uniref:3-oxoacyl-[acyl-carrier-protein] reductase n=1 Tax=Arcobacter porcinus TaxID=1935204 RepID=A0ABX2YER6_9BACT|nr:3-oxoacyl-ACP reductase FabG [Arcobacter porcinus]OCL81708.1 3-oxoacyl-[acyl-carrier-protein] reductase FabG [Arcobacter porcinus]OCL84500.1 3-oxoacyl-[acyl-carrier-protein] reductase FabG [Arcobacter porcinus]OCL89041.1 3-oxoacyl-[acyl-carrier-protein] reductase FabG [Arcobacter porcinus]OCL93517.1 3-oxoacyl-[acyl-carrier-protein] reductase FabG [Arcobacter porcinus]
MKFTGKNVLVTGASKGIGAEIAKNLASYGLKVWINYRSKIEEAEAVKEEIEKAGGTAAIIKADVSIEEEFINAIKTIVDSDGEISYLVNNAGITKDKLALRMSVEDFTDVINANLVSTFIGCRESLKTMSKKRFGAVVNISSIVGEMGNPGQTNYSASKGGVNTMTKSFAKEGASRNIRFNSVTPGFIKTDMTDLLKDEVKAEYEKNIPLSRFGNPSEIADAVAFLLSDHSSYITGEILKVNGGLYV